ncbi:hypothetical protein [Poseidonocella sedimentorum]|uniref:Uncharacterized protein n=1 Tax=Poseidonocella sedimentorum TaxID=871652 RepID=A0A1I6DKQ6_9RHOB|nr:hypothetical protein [Poseidonocella sedimentorum]SFR05922.1 hypothetical protein SAMN04515673_10422 [Poseidonocella sedimentorum]
MTKPHFSFWIICGLGLVWNLMGCLNFIVQMNQDVVAQMSELYQLIIKSRPFWATIAFAVAVFGGAVGCILLLLRRRVAKQVLLVSLIGIALTLVQTVSVVGMAPSALLALLVGAALFWYSTIAARAGWLR